MNTLTMCIIIFVLTLIGFVVGIRYVSISIIALIGMMLMVLTGCLDAKTALAGFGNGSAVLMASMFVVSAGLSRTQMINKLSGFIVRISKGSFTRALAGYVVLTFILAQFIPSAIVCFSIVSPLALGLCKEMKVNPSKIMFSLGITAITTVITLPFSAAVSEMARIQGFLEAYDYTTFNMTLLDITWAKLPISIVTLLLAIFVIPRLTPDITSTDVDFSGAKSQVNTTEKKLDPVREFIGYATFAAVLLGFLFSNQIGLPTWEIAMIGALVIAASGMMDRKSLINSMNLPMVLLYIGSLGLGNGLSQTGAAELIGGQLSKILVATHSNFLAGLIMFLVPFVLTQFMLNMGIYSIFAPLYIMICKSLGANPIGPIMICMISSMTAYLSPLGNPTVPALMSAGGYSTQDLVKVGLIPAVVIGIVTVFWVMTVFPIF